MFARRLLPHSLTGLGDRGYWEHHGPYKPLTLKPQNRRGLGFRVSGFRVKAILGYIAGEDLGAEDLGLRLEVCVLRMYSLQLLAVRSWCALVPLGVFNFSGCFGAALEITGALRKELL